MGSSDPPYLYDSPSRRQVAYPYSDFDPRAATRASWDRATLASQPRPKQEGPLIDFNKHPDSYMIVSGSQVEHKQLPANTKKNIKIVRWVQFALRMLQLLGSLGALVCVICVNNTETAQGYIMRVPVAWDVLISLYAVYHLVRPAKGRTPSSSASYHLFAMFMDGGLIPFYAFIAIFAKQNFDAAPGTEGRWTSFFTNDDSTNQLLNAMWLIAVAQGGLHLLSIGIDIYLIIMFRKIARLPPDMNPLEDNLTSRRTAKHQYKNSEASASTVSMAQRPGYLSGSTLNLTDTHLSKGMIDDRNVPFRHSRMGSDTAFSPHNPQSARLSRQQFDEQSMYQQAQSMRGSRQSFANHSRSGSVPASKRGSVVDLNDGSLPPLPNGPDRFNSPRPASFVSARSHVPENPARFSSPAAPNAAPTHAAVNAQQQTSLMQDNWYVLEDNQAAETGDLGAPPTPDRLSSPGRQRSPVPNFSRPSPEPSPDPDRQAQRQPRLPTLLPEQQSTQQSSFVQQPLRMNPPTPPIEQQQIRNNRHSSYHPPQHNDEDTSKFSTTKRPVSHVDRAPLEEVAVNRSLTAASHHTAGSSVYSESAPALDSATTPTPSTSNLHASPSVLSAGKPKGRYYGNLAAATNGIRKNGDAKYAPLNQAESSDMSTGKYGKPSPPKHQSMPYGGYGGGAGRVVSRSGADIADESLYSQGAQRDGRRRLVSGKVAEEGMAGERW